MSAPASVVEELGPETIYLQLSDHLTDLVENSNDIRSRRELVKAHLGKDAFFVSGLAYDRLQRGPEGDVFAVPQFDLGRD